MTKIERTGWRDEALSLRHREWGIDCPMTDVDFLAVEYDSGSAVAMVEYKNMNAKVQHSGHPSYRAISGICNAAKIPFFAVRYADDLSAFMVRPLNGYAVREMSEPALMSEMEYVEFLYRVRGRVVPMQVRERIE